MDSPAAPRGLRSVKEDLFGNLVQVHTFHREHFLPALRACELDPLKLGDTFVSCRQQLGLYVSYCANKSHSDAVYRDHQLYFEVGCSSRASKAAGTPPPPPQRS